MKTKMFSILFSGTLRHLWIINVKLLVVSGQNTIDTELTDILFSQKVQVFSFIYTLWLYRPANNAIVPLSPWSLSQSKLIYTQNSSNCIRMLNAGSMSSAIISVLVHSPFSNLLFQWILQLPCCLNFNICLSLYFYMWYNNLIHWIHFLNILKISIVCTRIKWSNIIF